MPIECIAASDLALELAEEIHAKLSGTSAYLGCFEVDKGNPLVLTLAANGLIPFCCYDRGVLKWIVPFDLPRKDRKPPTWTEGLKFDAVEFTSDTPSHLPNDPLSSMGIETTKLLESRARVRHAKPSEYT